MSSEKTAVGTWQNKAASIMRRWAPVANGRMKAWRTPSTDNNIIVLLAEPIELQRGITLYVRRLRLCNYQPRGSGQGGEGHYAKEAAKMK
ncbi:Hypothetical protein NTJ_06363 [Nesidiocoris tenuis]|uniref:Uncharacterized protein n=1 Tax=Nesidiocoris tenuis TaxID=355587 RepID=A0ABN7AQJ0_9HEMI|nr:Hypothetical protein NTJ_06363 [Nesidiocoris tenuis]